MTTTNGTNGKDHEASHSLKWQLGFVNEAGKFLTAEPFGFKLNVSATSMKQRQIWTVEPDSTSQVMLIRSHLNRYLAADKDGNVRCDEEEAGPESRFLVEYNTTENKQAGWAIKSESYNYYLTGTNDNIKCFSKTPVFWSIQLAMHPQVHLRHLVRKRYLRLEDDELHANQLLPWGYDSLITLEHNKGRVAIRSRDKRYLHREGQLQDKVSEDALYSLELRSQTGIPCLAFRDTEGKYLTLIGSSATMKSKNKTVGKDELFIVEESYPQVGICAFNGKYASVKQGVDVYANQSELEEKETFQLEFVSDKKWRIRTYQGKLWTIANSNGGIKGSGADNDASSVFEMEYLEDGAVSLRGSNSQYVSSKKLGLVSATSEKLGEEERFHLILVNRPLIVFKCDYGFIGTRSGRVECNFVNYEAFSLESAPSGQYFIKVNNGDYWQVANSNKAIEIGSGGEPQKFILEFQSGHKLYIKAATNGCYLRGEQNGSIRADADESSNAILWEF